jgi:AcrR family transcriptional regulator
VNATSKLLAVAVVNGPGSKRRAQAEATRGRIIRHAYALFCDLGYKSTTMDVVAQHAGVAVQTVYFVFRTKDNLLQAVHEWTVLGDNPTPPPLQDWAIAAAAEPDGRRALRMNVAGVAAILARMAPMIPVFHAVSQEPAGDVLRQSEDLRREGMTDLAASLAKRTPLAAGMTRRRAADLLFVLTGPESYRAFVLGCGWSPRHWVQWVSDILVRELFGEEPAAGATGQGRSG